MPVDAAEWICRIANACQDTAALNVDTDVALILESIATATGLPVIGLEAPAFSVARGILADTLGRMSVRFGSVGDVSIELMCIPCAGDLFQLERNVRRVCAKLEPSPKSAQRVWLQRPGFLPSDDRVAAAIEYIHRNLGANDLRLSTVARSVGLSACHFDRLFMSQVGTGLRAYIRTARLERGKIELLDARKSVKEVAFGVAYKTSASFCRDFRVRFGETPGSFRSRRGGCPVSLAGDLGIATSLGQQVGTR
jgi:AraC-like DNA-binding protein